MTLNFYIGANGTIWDKFICAVTRSRFSHVELVFPNGLSWSSSTRNGGVRQANIRYTDHWVSIPCPNVSESLFLQEKGKQYDYIGLLGTIIRLPVFSSRRKWFCSEIIAEALGLKDSWKHTPEDLYQMYK